jgi:crotonobetainyl-CoA:carnitine CoA-transferase CaiB-like acyl-CoA transferase
VLSVGEVLEDEHIKARGAFSRHKHPHGGEITLLNPWIRMSETPASIRAMSPAIGEHTSEVLTGLLGLSAEQVHELRAESVVR